MFGFSFITFIISTTLTFAPPCLGPFNEPNEAAIVEYVSVPVLDTT